MSENPQAFPVSCPGDGWVPHNGMSLLDYFAGQALAGILADGAGEDDDQFLRAIIARDAYDYAQAMLDERKCRS